jgi:hypothetical protein
MVALMVVLLLRWFYLEIGRGLPTTSLRHIDTPEPPGEDDPQDELSSWFPEKADRKLRKGLKELANGEPGHEHIIRVWLATGDTIINKQKYFERFFDILRPKAHLDVRVLMIDPDSPMIRDCGHEDWAEEVRESCGRLKAIRDRYINRKNFTLTWRAYESPPMIRLTRSRSITGNQPDNPAPRPAETASGGMDLTSPDLERSTFRFDSVPATRIINR